MSFHIPAAAFTLGNARQVACPMDWVLTQVTRPISDRERSLYRHEGRWMGSIPIPDFQRPLVWDRERQIKFVESAWLGYSLGTFVINDLQMVSHGDKFHPLEGLLVDGQQRLDALRGYFMDEFPVFGALWSEVPTGDARRFRNKPSFPYLSVQITDEAQLREAYNRLAFGGIAHTEAQRA